MSIQISVKFFSYFSCSLSLWKKILNSFSQILLIFILHSFSPVLVDEK